jgi:hypothetical protein
MRNLEIREVRSKGSVLELATLSHPSQEWPGAKEEEIGDHTANRVLRKGGRSGCEWIMYEVG